jgi:hypothetical protein
VVIEALQFASKAARELGIEPNPEWGIIAANIPILQFEDGTTREHETYNGEMIKQTDVNLLAYPLNIINDPETIRKDLEYYQPRLDPGVRENALHKTCSFFCIKPAPFFLPCIKPAFKGPGNGGFATVGATQPPW